MATVNEYLEQESKVSANTLVVQPWLENFAKQYNKLHPGHIGSCLYTDVTILAGPHDNYFWNTKAGNLLRERYQRGEVSIFCVKSDNAAFIIEYRLGGQKLFHHGDLWFVRHIKQQSHLISCTMAKNTRCHWTLRWRRNTCVRPRNIVMYWPIIWGNKGVMYAKQFIKRASPVL